MKIYEILKEGRETDMPSTEFNVSINELKKQERNARKRSKDPIAISHMEKPFSEFFPSDSEMTIETSEIFLKQHIDKNSLDEANIRISDTEVYNASYLMMPELMQGSTSVKQVVPKEVSDKIDYLFYQDKYKQMYMMLKLYLNGFTIDEVAEFYSVTKQTVSVAMKRAKKRILDNLTVEELATFYWWLRVDKPLVNQPTDESSQLDYKLKYERPVIDTSNYKKAIANGEVKTGKLVNGSIVWDEL